MDDEQLPKDLVAASAAPLLLSVLCGGETYGYAIIAELRRRSNGDLAWSEGMLYPLLHRLEKRGLIESEWRTPEQGRKRKYYRITDAGRASLAVKKQQWNLVNQLLEGLWKETYV